MKRRLMIAALSLIAASCRGSVAEGRRVLVERAGVAMGSGLQLRAWTTDEASARSAFEAVFAEFERLEALMSTWRPGSDVLRINAAAGVQPVPVDADVRDVLRQARQISEWTEGAFDGGAAAFGCAASAGRNDQTQRGDCEESFHQ